MNALEIVGKPRIYNIDGSGRDTYIGFNNGGNTELYSPASAFKSGKLRSPRHQFRDLGLGSPNKKFHYPVDGTGRDSYIKESDGGFTYGYSRMNDREAYVSSLRGYHEN